jgi:hypothetical protein
MLMWYPSKNPELKTVSEIFAALSRPPLFVKIFLNLYSPLLIYHDIKLFLFCINSLPCKSIISIKLDLFVSASFKLQLYKNCDEMLS